MICINKMLLRSQSQCVKHLHENAALRQKVVILGAGWGGFRMARDLDKNKFDVIVASPRNHFLFTPLLPSTAVGTLEFRCVQVIVVQFAKEMFHSNW